MATRFPLQSSLIPSISPAFGTGWNTTNAPTTALRLQLLLQKLGSAKVERQIGASTALNPELLLGVQWVCPYRLAAQTITGTVKGVIMCYENNALFIGTIALGIRVVNGSGVHQAHLTNGATAAPVCSVNAATPPQFVAGSAPGVNRQFLDAADSPTIALTDYACAAGDLLVAEVGARDADSGTSRSGFIRFGDNAGSDLAENSTGTSDLDPWIEFSHNFVFLDDVFGARAARRRGRGR